MRKRRVLMSLGRRRHDHWTVRVVRVELLPILIEDAGAVGTHELSRGKVQKRLPGFGFADSDATHVIIWGVSVCAVWRG